MTIIKRQGASLPHWHKKDAIYSVVFRLKDSVPQTVLEQWNFERREILRNAAKQRRPPTRDERMRLRELTTPSIIRYLRNGYGACHMKQKEVAEIVANTFKFFENTRYFLYAWCVMPNHVHVVVRPLGRFSLSSILHSWKTFSAKEANKFLKRKGGFWQRESYDHLIRSRRELLHAMEYTWENPERAGLKNWEWKWCREPLFQELIQEDDALIRSL